MSNFTLKKSGSNLRYWMVLFFSVLFIILGAISVGRMNENWLIFTCLILTVVYLIVLKSDWKTFYHFVRQALIITFLFEVLFFLAGIYFQNPTLIQVARILCYGTVSIVLLIPSVMDSLAILLPKDNFISSFLESFILLRNVIGGIGNDFFIGIITSPNATSLTGKIKHTYLSVEAIIARTPEFATNFGIALIITKFEVHNLKYIASPSMKFLFSLVVFSLYFLLLL